MKLNPDLIRDILFTVEEETGFGKEFWFREGDNCSKKWADFALLKNYDYKEVCYHLKQCDDMGYFSSHGRTVRSLTFWLTGGFMVQDLSPMGHEFINAISDDRNWKTVKGKAKKIGSFGLDTLQKIAVAVIAAQMNKVL